jgi:hypothetical protein
MSDLDQKRVSQPATVDNAGRQPPAWSDVDKAALALARQIAELQRQMADLQAQKGREEAAHAGPSERSGRDKRMVTLQQTGDEPEQSSEGGSGDEYDEADEAADEFAHLHS